LSHSPRRSPTPSPAPTIRPFEPAKFDEQLFGKEVAQSHRADDSHAFAIVSWILFAIVLSGCLLMLGTVWFVF